MPCIWVRWTALMFFLQLCYFVFYQRCYDQRCYLTPYRSYCGQNADICMKENGVCVSHYSPSRRDEVKLICLCLSENSVSELITFLVVDQDVLYTEELKRLP